MRVPAPAFVAGALLLPACRLEAALVDGLEMLVHDSIITFFEVSQRAEEPSEKVVRDFGDDTSGAERELARIHGEVLNEMLERRLILHEFETSGYSLPDRVMEEILEAEIRARFGDRATAIRTLANQGETIADFRRLVRERFIVQAMREKHIQAETIISPAKVQSYYDLHRGDFRVGDQVHLRLIVLKAYQAPGEPSALQLATELRSKVVSGASFTDLATMYSQESRSRQGGDWGWWERSRLTRVFAEIAERLTTGECSPVFSRSEGEDCWVCEYENGAPKIARHYTVDAASRKQLLVEERPLTARAASAALPPPQEFYLLKVDDVRPARFKPLTEVRNDIENNLLKLEQQRLHDVWIERLRKKTFVKSL